MTIYPQLISAALRTVHYPGKDGDIVSLGMLADDIRIDGNRVSFSLISSKVKDPFIGSVVKAAEAAILLHVGNDVDIKGNIKVITPEPAKKEAERPLPGVKNIIGVSSGKGGVGKSTVASNLAVALAQQGYSVGLLDADIFGPSQPKMFGVEDEQLYVEPDTAGKNWILPLEKYGVKMLSIGFVVDKDKAVLWRGAMASNALKQLINDAKWGDLDYFIIDMPPGTSDIHLTLVQTLAITGAIVVTTPQEVALADARKGVSMFMGEQVNVPVLGIIENMSWFTQSAHPDERYYIFGRDGGKNLAAALDVELLGQVPLVAGICRGGDDGVPVILQNTVSGKAFMELASRVTAAVERRNAELPPTHVVQTH